MVMCQTSAVVCPDLLGCIPGVCPDFEIKRHDTYPSFVVAVSDCEGPLDLEDTVLEVSMWAKGKLKRNITASDEYFALANDIGFQQSLVGDIILMDRARGPEMMLVTGHDETNKLIHVQRAYHGTSASAYKKGTALKLFRTLNSVGSTNMVRETVEQLDGTTEETLTESQLIYAFNSNDTCLPGCYWMEFKLLKMDVSGSMWINSLSIVPTFTSVTPSQNGCYLGNNVVSERRFPVNAEGFLIKINDSPTSEVLF